MSIVIRENINIFQKVVHVSSGIEFDQMYLNQGTYVESLELNGPKLMLTYRDPENYITSKIQLKEYDDLEVTFGDPWMDDGVSEVETFTVLTCRPVQDGNVEINALAKPVYMMKVISDKARIFTQRGFPEILKSIAQKGMKFDMSAFPVVQNYHVLPGERPTTMLRQITKEQGALIWYARGSMHMSKFGTLFAKEPVATFEHGNASAKKMILKYEKPSEQVAAQENSLRTFTGWDEKEGRVKAPLNNPLLSKMKSKPAAFSPGGNNPFVLGNAIVAKKIAIDFIASGSFAVEPGQTLALRWRQPNVDEPLNEGMPDKVVVDTVSHWYMPQKYAIRVKGAVAVEPY
ncbi:MAG: hypothetical protein IJU76_14325 [Desulfovibrionaceae bacterium]|nr:hypothetical protein [Desulfovibrionaceae bacterium]